MHEEVIYKGESFPGRHPALIYRSVGVSVAVMRKSRTRTLLELGSSFHQCSRIVFGLMYEALPDVAQVLLVLSFLAAAVGLAWQLATTIGNLVSMRRPLNVIQSRFERADSQSLIWSVAIVLSLTPALSVPGGLAVESIKDGDWQSAVVLLTLSTLGIMLVLSFIINRAMVSARRVELDFRYLLRDFTDDADAGFIMRPLDSWKRKLVEAEAIDGEPRQRGSRIRHYFEADLIVQAGDFDPNEQRFTGATRVVRYPDGFHVATSSIRGASWFMPAVAILIFLLTPAVVNASIVDWWLLLPASLVACILIALASIFGLMTQLRVEARERVAQIQAMAAVQAEILDAAPAWQTLSQRLGFGIPRRVSRQSKRSPG